MANKLMQAQVRELFDYRAGKLYWRESGKGRKMGVEAGSPDSKGYRRIGVYGHGYRTHQLVFLWHRGYIPVFIDHKNHNKIDNRIANLRDVTKAENAWNTSKSPRGTIFHRVNKRWLALIRKNGKVKYLGSFKTEEEAHQHYLSMKPLYHSIPVRSGSPKNQNSLKFQNNAP